MPTASKPASSAPQINMPDLLQEPIKNMVCVLDKKLRNLEKRKLKLVETKKKADDGSTVLNEDQKKALESLSLVDNSLITVKEIHKTLGGVEQEYVKLARKDQKRVKLEQTQHLEQKSQESVLRTIQIQAILGELSEEVRPDFINAQNGACALTEEELSNLDSFYELINVSSDSKKTNFSSRVAEVAMHIFNVIDSKEKVAFEEVTYKEINDILTRIQDCGYFDKADEVVEEEAVEAEEEGELEAEAVVEDEESAVDGDEEEAVEVSEDSEEAVIVEPTEAVPEAVYDDEDHDDGSPVELSPADEPVMDSGEPVFMQDASADELEIAEPVPVEIPETNGIGGVDLPPEVQQTTPDNEEINFLAESEVPQAQIEAHQLSLNPVSPEFVPRNLHPAPVEETNGWSEPPAAPAATPAPAPVVNSNSNHNNSSNDSSGWNETPSGGDNDWQAVPDTYQNSNGGYRGGRGRGGGGGRGGGFGGGFNNRSAPQ